jgi:hypothetical protein
MSFHKDVPWGGRGEYDGFGPFKLCWVPNTDSWGIGGDRTDSSSLAMPKGHTTVLTARLVVSVTQRLKLLSSG